MSINEVESKARELQELKRMREELDTEITALEDAIKAEMGDTDLLMAGAYKITWKPVASSRIDTAALKRELPDIAARFTLKTMTRRFCVN